MKLRHLFLAGLGILGVWTLVVGPNVAVAFYHDRVFPLGRLAAEIRAGDRYEDVQAKMVLYQQAFGAHRPVELSEEVDGLELRDVSVFEPLELRVRFDAEGRVSETHFSAD